MISGRNWMNCIAGAIAMHWPKTCFMQHLLKKQVIDLEISSSLNAYAVQHSMSDHFWKHIYPLLEKIFDELGSENEFIKLDKLEIDLGCITQEYLERATWPATYLQEIEQKLRSGIKSHLEEKKEFKEPKGTAIFKQWLFYMENGHLPWNGIDLKKESTTVLESLATEYSSITALRQLLRNPVALNRIILQHNESFLQNIVAVLTTKKQQGLINFINEMMALPGVLQQQPKPGTSFLPVHHARKNIWQQVLNFAAAKEQPGLQEVMHHVLLQQISNATTAHRLVADPSVKKLALYSIVSRIAASFPEPLNNESTSQKNTHQNGEELQPSAKISDQPNDEPAAPHSPAGQNDQHITPGKKSTAENKTASSRQKRANKHASPALNTEQKAVPANNTASTNKNSSSLINNDKPQPAAASDEFGLSGLEPGSTMDLEEGLFIGFAGLVLVHPFLFTLFKKLNWIENGKFTSLDDQQRALYLLQYMATGETTAEEYELVIAKLLCGYPLQLPVAREISIEPEIIAEAGNMLEAVIAQWEILGKTSITGLREGFFHRSGKLFTKNERMYLHVESKSIDLLLDQLPWNLSIIKLPWMEQMLNVDWR